MTVVHVLFVICEHSAAKCIAAVVGLVGIHSLGTIHCVCGGIFLGAGLMGGGSDGLIWSWCQYFVEHKLPSYSWPAIIWNACLSGSLFAL